MDRGEPPRILVDLGQTGNKSKVVVPGTNLGQWVSEIDIHSGVDDFTEVTLRLKGVIVEGIPKLRRKRMITKPGKPAQAPSEEK